MIVLDITVESDGNAWDSAWQTTSRRVIDKVDIKATYTNALVSGIWASARLPMALDNDREALDAALARFHPP